MLPIAVDALGGDAAPGAVVDAAIAAARAGHDLVLVGPVDRLRDMVGAARGAGLSNLSFEDAPDAVGMDESPLAALRRKPRASIAVACGLAASGRAAGAYSAGHTGAALIAAHAAFGLTPGVERPALAVTVPTRRGASILLDAGANVDCRPSHLAAFAVMGRAYAEVALDVADPSVALLSNGEEPTKGNELVKSAHALLAALPLRFAGNIDAAQWLDGTADVVVTDGFTGNVALKVGESVVAMAMTLAGANAGVPAEAWSRFDHAKAGGAPLIGVNGLLVVGHGRADAAAIANGIALTARLAAEGLTARVAEAVGRVLK